MNRRLLYCLTVLALSTTCSAAFAGGADNVGVDLRGHGNDVILKSGGADNVGIDLRGRGNDVILKSGGADNVGVDLRGRGNDLIPKRQGADDPAGHIRRARGADDLVNMRHARGHR